MATVTFKGATRIYPGSTKPALDKLDLEVHDQEFLVLLNPPLLEEVKMAPVPMTDMLMYPLRLKVSMTLPSLSSSLSYIGSRTPGSHCAAC